MNQAVSSEYDELIRKPEFFGLGTNNVCNSKCSFCPSKDIKRKRNSMSMDLFQNIIGQIQSTDCRFVRMSGRISDVLLDPLLADRLRQLRESFNKEDLRITLITNLIALQDHSEQDVEYIVRSLNVLSISVGPNQFVYEKMFGVDCFEKVLSNLFSLLELKNKFADSARIVIAGRGCGEDFDADPRLMQVTEGLTGKSYIEWHNIYRNWGGSYDLPELPLKTRVIRNELPNYGIVPCYYALNPHIDDKGLFVACSCAGLTDDFVMGDLKKESLNDLLISKRRKSFINSFIKGKFPKHCKKCSFYIPDRSINWSLYLQEEHHSKEPTPTSFYDYNYAKHRHFDVLEKYSSELYMHTIDPERSDLKEYQDLLVLSFIRNNIPPGACILEVGGGNSRVLNKLHSEYECWNIDKFEGLGQGPKNVEQHPYTLVTAYMGDFSDELPSDYFHFVFSISALEHVDPCDTELHQNIVSDINRVLTYGGYSLHCFDIIVGAGLERDYYDYIYHGLSLEKSERKKWSKAFKILNMHSRWNYIPKVIDTFFKVSGKLNQMPSYEQLFYSSDVWTMSKSAYDRGWKPIVKYDYSSVGYPTTLNILWKKVE
ncbi:MAG: methyltransferase domain-containing protein [Deltaproteobacteria bacterium]|nr:methyltransferase domain-containing protein [Candidatus Zymogenaceae bacterium]